MKAFTFTGKKTREISFPLGGIGSGCIGLAGNGRLMDWEIFNRPNKGSVNGFSHFAIKAEKKGTLLDARVLNADLQKDFMGQYGKLQDKGYGFGPYRETMAGFPHFRNCTFTGKFPIAELLFKEEKFPAAVKLTAFNPLIPLKENDSSIPAAFFEVSFENTTNWDLDYTACLSMKNPFTEATVNQAFQDGNLTGLNLFQKKLPASDVSYGDLSFATDAEKVSYQEYWFRGSWFDDLGIFWRNFTESEALQNRFYSTPGHGDMASLAASVHVKAGKTKRLRFILSWNFPNQYNYWNNSAPSDTPETWKNYYATLFPDSVSSASYGLKSWNRLEKETRTFQAALFQTSIPSPALDAVSSCLAVLKSPTVLRLEDGSFYGWEGVNEQSGSCEGSCTHVWNYAYALPFLFPRLERSMRDLDYSYNLCEDGRMGFRLQLPAGMPASSIRACVDGQMGGVIKLYRDWKLCGDDHWLKKLWPKVKKSLEYAWSPDNPDRWDFDKDGVLEGRQHHTLDMELFSPNAWLEGFYLAALKAAAEIAEYLGEAETAAEYRRLFENGRSWTEAHLFNGAYYIQKIDLSDRSLLQPFEGAEQSYWNSEAGEIKYQIGEGCEIDQICAQWHADLCGLGDIFEKSHRKSALKSLYANNFKASMRDIYNPCRLYCINDEAGAVICDYPKEAYKPVVPVPYCEETMHGFEYQLAASLIRNGFISKGMRIVKSVRDRYDGEKRNPWNEMECGSNYARSMAAYSLIPAFSGFSYDLPHGVIGFDPVASMEKGFQTIWSLDCGWGTFTVSEATVKITLIGGNLPIQKLLLPFLKKKRPKKVTADGKSIDFTFKNGCLAFSANATIHKELLISRF